MDTPRRCPRCGTELTAGSPEQLCPRCLLLAGLESQGSVSPPTAVYVPGFAAPPPEELGKFFPQLEILELLGKGGMGAVYKARQPGLDRLVALKILPPDVGGDAAFSERFTREARALAKLNHPNIVGVFDFGHVFPSGLRGEAQAVSGQQGLYYFVMEFVDGVNLRQALRAGNLKAAEALKIVPQICDALQFAHDEGVVHRDIKPENILLDKRGRVKIADFGLAKLLGSKVDHGLTGTHQVMGTPHYMAPEQIQGTRDVDHRADIYSLGVTFYEMLTGELPIGRFTLPSKKVHIDVRLDEVVLRALEVEPEKRYQHASEVKTEMDEIARSPIGVKIEEAPHGPGGPLSASLERVIADLLPDDKVAAVRIYREATGAGLAPAMSAVKAIAQKHGKDRPVPALTPELVFRCLLGAAGFIAGGLWLAQMQQWGPGRFMFTVGGLLLGVFWVSSTYTDHLRKSRWQLADFEDTVPGKKAPPQPDTGTAFSERALPWFYGAGRTLRWFWGRFVFLVRREWHWLRGGQTVPEPHPEGETKVSTHARPPRLTLGSAIAGAARLFAWIVSRLFALAMLPWKLLRRAWWIFPLGWTVLCVIVFAGVWRPGGFLDRFYWPYQGSNESNVVLRPTAKIIERIVVSQRRASQVQGSSNIGQLQSDFDKESLLRDDYEIMVRPAKQATNFSLEVDGLNRLAWHFSDFRGAEHQGDLPVDLATMVQFLNSCGVDWSGADVNEMAKPLLDIILLSFTTEHIGGMWLSNQRQPGRLEAIVANQEQIYQQQMKDYPFSEHIGTAIAKTGPVVPILWVGVPVMLALWAIGMLWLRRMASGGR